MTLAMNLFSIARILTSSRGLAHRAYRKNDWFKKERAGIGHRSKQLRRDLGPTYQPEYDGELDEKQDFSQLDKMYDSHKEELARRRKIGSQKNIERKHFKKEKQPNMLTWAAKEQIRYLYHTSSEEWPLQRLAEGFSVSKDVIRKIIKAQYTLKPAQIERHDTAVVNNWKRLGYQNGPVYSIHKSGDFLVAIENYELEKEAKFNEIEPGSESKVGLFEKIVKHYRIKVEELKGQDSEHSAKKLIEEPPRTARGDNRLTAEYAKLSQNEDKSTKDKKATSLVQTKTTMKEQERLGDAGYLLSSDRDGEEMKPLTGRKELVKGDTISPRNQAPSPADPLHADEILASTKHSYRKFKEDTEEFTVEESRRGHLEAYKYQEDTGYQRPWGSEELSPPDKIEIPPEKRKKGSLYRFGNAYYDEDGRFVYSVPFS